MPLLVMEQAFIRLELLELVGEDKVVAVLPVPVVLVLVLVLVDTMPLLLVVLLLAAIETLLEDDVAVDRSPLLFDAFILL